MWALWVKVPCLELPESCWVSFLKGTGNQKRSWFGGSRYLVTRSKWINWWDVLWKRSAFWSNTFETVLSDALVVMIDVGVMSIDISGVRHELHHCKLQESRNLLCMCTNVCRQNPFICTHICVDICTYSYTHYFNLIYNWKSVYIIKTHTLTHTYTLLLKLLTLLDDSLRFHGQSFCVMWRCP